MNRRQLLVVAAWSMAAACTSALAQASAENLIGLWRIEVQGDDRARQLQVVSAGERQGDTVSLDARWGWWGERAGPVKASAQVTGDAVRIEVTTATSSVVSAALDPQGNLSGTFQSPRGKISTLTGVRTAAAAAGVAPAAMPPGEEAKAAARPGLLGAAEVKQLSEGRVWVFVRNSDKQKIRWDLRRNGMLYGNNMSTGGQDSARWSLNEQGQVCVEWRGNSNNICVGLRQVADKLEMIDGKAPRKVFGELSIE